MQKIQLVVTLIACLFLSMLGGALIARYQLFPAGLFSASESVDGLAMGSLAARDAALRELLHPIAIPSPAVAGVVAYDPLRTAPGYTLLTPAAPGLPLRLIDMDGESVHEWYIPGEWLPADTVATGAAKVFARLLPAGDLLLAIASADEATARSGIIRINKDSRLLWEYSAPVREVLDVAADGTVYALLQENITTPWPGLEHVATPFTDSVVVALDIDGNELRRVSVLQAMQNSGNGFLLQYADPDKHTGDLLDINSITYLDAATAALLPDAAAGNVLISIRQLDLVAVLDLDMPAIRWAVRGSWHLQSDPDVLANGHILLFDSQGDLQNGGSSRLLEFDPATLEISWQYRGDGNNPLFVPLHGSQQRLPNGNTLLAATDKGRLLEVTAAGDIVWDYRVPDMQQAGNTGKTVSTLNAQRFTPEQLSFLSVAAEVVQ